MTTCREKNCSKTKIAAKGLCSAHYRQQHTPSDKKYAPRGLTAGGRLVWKGWDVTSEGCWETRYFRDPNGYGMVPTPGETSSTTRAHRVAYEHFIGPIPPDLGEHHGTVVRHKCDNPPCVNPAHLELGTQAQNMADVHRRNRPRATQSPYKNLTREQIAEAKELIENQGWSKTAVAVKFGVTTPAIIGLVKRGYAYSRKSKLTPEDVRRIKELLADAELTVNEIAEKFGVSASHISNIKAGRTHAND